MSKEKFVIAPHMRLQEWVAEEKGYFDEEGLDYEFLDLLISDDGKKHDLGDKVGAYQTFEKGRSCDISSACHWTVNAAAASGHGKLYRDAYSVSPCGVFVPADSDIHKPEDLAGVPISVGYQSGSHYSTIQALEQWLAPDDINLSFSDGLLFKRLELLVDGKVPAASLFSAPYYVVEQLGFRKICDSTFMMSGMISGAPDIKDVRKYYSALRPARHRSAARALHPLLSQGTAGAVSRHDRRAADGPGGADCLRILLAGHLRELPCLDRRARHLSRRGRPGRRKLRRGDGFPGGLVGTGWRAGLKPARNQSRCRGRPRNCNRVSRFRS
jgi:hypothetical protein